jgi:hypothetical protein
MADSRVWHTRITDMDRPLHRIFPVWLLEQALRSRKLTLVKPSLWIDPREDLCSMFHLKSRIDPRRPLQALANYLAPSWAQCWSYETNSDVLLRAYSRVALDPIAKRNTDPANEGVRITTTARKLIAAAEQWAKRTPDHHFFLGCVKYEEEKVFGQSLANKLSNKDGPKYFSTPQGRADSLFVKRAMFRHEDEVRLLCIGTGKLDEGEKIKQFDIDPNSLFDEISFDPRLIAFERLEREAKIRDLGFTGKVVEDPSYLPVLTEILMSSDWPDPD